MKILKSHPTGSSYICNPPVTTTDIDRIYLVDNTEGLFDHMRGWDFNSSDEYPATLQFYSFKKEEDGVTLNALITPDEKYYNQFVLATEVAKKMNLLEKEDRVMLFTAMLMPICPLPDKMEKLLSENTSNP